MKYSKWIGKKDDNYHYSSFSLKTLNTIVKGVDMELLHVFKHQCDYKRVFIGLG